ncbi:IS481 family transposase [Promicromonospora sp. Marseille-Q5078]
MALVVLSVVEQRLDVVRAVLAGAEVNEVATRAGVHRATVHRWVTRYLAGQIGGLADRSHRPVSSPRKVDEAVEVLVAEMRREHPRWGAKRIRLELLRTKGPWAREDIVVPSERTIVRILHRQGLVRARPRKRPRSSFVRFERPGPMQLWGIDIVGGIELVNTTTGELREAKIVTGVDDHSRFCVMAAVVERATGRAVCLAFAQALAAYGVPEEVITDNGTQFTARFAKGGEVLFDKICRNNAITHRLTQPASPNQNGKVERFHGTFRPEIGEQGPFTSLAEAQAAVDVWVAHYNGQRPHQGLDENVPVVPADRFAAAPAGELPLWVPPTLVQARPGGVLPGVDDDVVLDVEDAQTPMDVVETAPALVVSGDAIELDRVVPASGNLALRGNQFWLGPDRSGQTVRLWIDCDWVHLSAAGQRIKSLRSRFTEADLRLLVTRGATAAGPAPAASRSGPGARDGLTIMEVERTVSRNGTVSLGSHVVHAADVLAGRRVGIYIEDGRPLLFFDPGTRELLRSRPNPLGPVAAMRLQRALPPGLPPRPSIEPITVQRRPSATGVIVVAGQKISLGRTHAGATVTVHVAETTLAIELPDGETTIIARTTTTPVRSIKGQRPRTAKTS